MKAKPKYTGKEIEQNFEEFIYPSNMNSKPQVKSITNIDKQNITTNDQMKSDENLWNENAFNNDNLDENLDTLNSKFNIKKVNLGNEEEDKY